jgi:glycosyltransferase involved in cell wall biosynthesis
MPKLKVIYIAGFNLDKNTGRNKATREKTNALQLLLSPECFTLLYPGRSSSRLIGYLKVFFFDWVMLRRLFFVEQNTRIIQRTTFLPLTNIYLKLRGVQIIYEIHTDMHDEIKHYHMGYFEKLILYLFVFAEKLNLRLASKIIYNHPVLQQMLPYNKPSIYSYNGCDPSAFYPMDTSACRAELKWKTGLTYYLFVGSLSKWRGVDLLIDIFKYHMSANEILFILGNSSHAYGIELKARAAGASNIIFHDEINSTEVIKYINAADICLVPVKPILKSPGNPLKLYDYIACGKPVVGQEEVMGCADEIIKYDAGIVTDFYNAERAANDLKLFYSSHDPEYYRMHNRETSLNQVSWRKRMEKWIKLAYHE